MNELHFDVDAMRARLLAERETLESFGDSNAEAAQTVELDQQRVGRISRVDALQQQAMHQESERRRKLELRRIASALDRMDGEDFGYCLSCGEIIAIERLEIDPAATQCITCARKADAQG